MTEYIISDLINFYDIVDQIEDDNIKKATLIITKDINHCPRLRCLGDKQITVRGLNKPEYDIWLAPRKISSDPNWFFNCTSFIHSNSYINYLNLYFTYLIQEFVCTNTSHEYDEKTNKYIEIIDVEDSPHFNSFNIRLMEFSRSVIVFKDCILENNTNRTFEIIAKKNSNITFINCLFDGDFIFSFDITSKISIR
jgi:hypothetical protein